MAYINLAGSGLGEAGKAMREMTPQMNAIRAERENLRRYEFGRARQIEQDQYKIEVDQRNFKRSNMEADRRFGLAEQSEQRRTMAEARYAWDDLREDVPDATRVSGQSVLEGLARLDNLDPASADKLRGRIAARLGKDDFTAEDLDANELDLIDTHTDTWTSFDDVRDSMTKKIIDAAVDGMDEMYADQIAGLSSEQSQRNAIRSMDAITKRLRAQSVDPSPGYAKERADNAAKAMAAVIQREKDRQVQITTIDGIMADENRMVMDGKGETAVAALRQELIFGDTPREAYIDILTRVKPEMGMAKEFGGKEAQAQMLQAEMERLTNAKKAHEVPGVPPPKKHEDLSGMEAWLESDSGLTVAEFLALSREERDAKAEVFLRVKAEAGAQRMRRAEFQKDNRMGAGYR